jgi:hypothetical protein
VHASCLEMLLPAMMCVTMGLVCCKVAVELPHLLGHAIIGVKITAAFKLLLRFHAAAGCTILTEAKSYAYARCGPTGAFSTSGSATTQVSTQPAVLGTNRSTAQGCDMKLSCGSLCHKMRVCFCTRHCGPQPTAS